MTWARRLGRVFKINIETLRECGGIMWAIACFEDPVVIRKTLDYLKDKAEIKAHTSPPRNRAPPACLFG